MLVGFYMHGSAASDLLEHSCAHRYAEIEYKQSLEGKCLQDKLKNSKKCDAPRDSVVY